MTVTVRNLTREPVVLTIPPDIGGWNRQRVAVQVRAGKGPRDGRPSKPGLKIHDRKFPHSLTLMAKGTEGSEIGGHPDALKTAPDFVAAQARRVIEIVDDKVEAPAPEAVAPVPVVSGEPTTPSAQGETTAPDASKAAVETARSSKR